MIEKTVENFDSEITALLNNYKKKPLWGWKDPATFQIIPYIHDKLTNPHYIYLNRDIDQIMNSIIKMSRRSNVLPSMVHELSLFDKWKQRFGILKRMYSVYQERGNLIHDKEFLEEFLNEAYMKIESFIKDKNHMTISFDDLINKTPEIIDNIADFLEIELTQKKKNHALKFVHTDLINFK
jgi:hypothetical protein